MQTNTNTPVRVINIIPANYKGDPHEALGYGWSKLVLERDSWSEERRKAEPIGGIKHTADSIPGEDVPWENMDKLYAELAESFPGIQYADHVLNLPRDAQVVARIYRMTSGGGCDIGYIGSPPIPFNYTPGENTSETSATLTVQENELAENINRKREQQPGWCNKCQSHCYGDCETA
jgi:hypothetical protein